MKNASVRNAFTLEDAEKLLEKVETSAIEALKLLIYWESLSADELLNTLGIKFTPIVFFEVRARREEFFF